MRYSSWSEMILNCLKKLSLSDIIPHAHCIWTNTQLSPLQCPRVHTAVKLHWLYYISICFYNLAWKCQCLMNCHIYFSIFFVNNNFYIHILFEFENEFIELIYNHARKYYNLMSYLSIYFYIFCLSTMIHMSKLNSIQYKLMNFDY